MGLLGRRRCCICITKVLILTIILVCCSSILNFLCITSVCEISDVSNPVWSDFGDVVVHEANKMPSGPSSKNRSQSNIRFNYASNENDQELSQTKKLDVVKRLKLLHLTSLDFCPKEQLFAGNVTLMAGRREISPIKRFLAVGIPSVTRTSAFYLNNTLTSIFEAVKKDEEKHVSIIAFLADSDKHTKQKQVNDLSRTFEKYLRNGMLQIIQAPIDYYKPLGNLHGTLGDKMSRVMWRSKQALDYSFLMCYCSSLSQYYLQLEDDVLASPSFVSKLIEFVGSHKEKWLSFNVAHLGYIGKLYPASEVQNLASYIRLFFNDMPVDWLEPRWKAYRGQDPSKTEKRAASLFQHVGLYSSFRPRESQRQNTLKEQYFDQFDHKYRGLNPPAEVSSDLISRVGQPVDAYASGDGFFWGYCGSAGSKVYDILLKDRANLQKIVIKTGSNFAATNFIMRGTVEVSSDLDSSNPNQCKEFVTIGEFRFGQVDVTQLQKHIMCIRIKVRYQGRGIFIREVNIWTS